MTGEVIDPMAIFPDTWQPFPELFEPEPDAVLWDGSAIYYSREDVDVQGPGAPLRLICGEARHMDFGAYPYLQVRAENVDVRDLSEPPDIMALQRRLLRESELTLAGIRFALELCVRSNERVYVAPGLVSIRLSLARAQTPSGYRARQLAGRQAEVATAHERGLIDNTIRRKADFRLQLAEMKHKIAALIDSDYLPDKEWAIDVNFAQWRDLETNEPRLTPVTNGLSELQFQFRRANVNRGFRIADLFASTTQPSTDG